MNKPKTPAQRMKEMRKRGTGQQESKISCTLETKERFLKLSSALQLTQDQTINVLIDNIKQQ